MNLSQLTTFHAVMTSPSLSDAAEKLGRTQPAVSASIKSLEDQLGMKLFERRGRKLVPVPEAMYLVTEANGILKQLSQVRRTMQELGTGQSGQLNVAAMPGPVSMLFPRFIANHVGDRENIKISMLARSSAQIAELARAQSIDFGFADLPENIDVEGLVRMDVLEGDCFLAIPSDHRLADENSVALEALDGQKLGSLQVNHFHTRATQAAFHEAGLSFNLGIESQTFLPILQFVAAGQCCAILDPLTAVHVSETGEDREAVKILRLRKPLRYRYAVLSPRHRPTSVIAEDACEAWSTEVFGLLKGISANPRWQTQAE
ncbi:MAG: LysR family transcriptional regulator [Pseudomonadota bacterium]